MARRFVEHKPCAACDSPITTILIGPPQTDEPYWLCFGCFLLTPAGVSLTQGQIRQQLGETSDELCTGEAVATDQPGGNGGP